jgi:hypothetical protein
MTYPEIKIIEGKIFGFYTGMALPPFKIFVSIQARDIMKTIRHEWTHVLQANELLIIFHYILYFVIWVLVGFSYRKHWMEREAYDNDENPSYNGSRRHFAWFKYFKQSKLITWIKNLNTNLIM